MPDPGRRAFLKSAAVAAGSLAAFEALPASICKALAIPAHAGTGTLDDVAHIVVLMQENRSFDHYLGHLSGVRGVNDRFPARQPDGRTVWQQPQGGFSSGTIAPFHLDTRTTNAQCIGDLDHGWRRTHLAIDGGRQDGWVRYKTAMTMGYHLRRDIPFHYALADAFTVCDHYFCSLPGPTHPNRMFLMTGTVDPSGKGGGPLVNNHDPVSFPSEPGFTWSTYPERLEEAGISWRIYQEGTNGHDAYHGNFGLNVLANFKRYIEAPPGSALHERAMTSRTLTQFAQDVKRGELPQVSWLLPPAAFSEHPRWTPAYGATYIDRVLTALTANPAVWSRTVLFIPYDENDGFFDHIVPPQPPVGGQGKSTVDVRDELHTYVDRSRRPVRPADGLPYGLGSRVPMLVVSPWSRGGVVCSDVCDHTSVIRFIERRFGVAEPNISAWRRTVCGDLVSSLDFSRRDIARPSLPDTSDYRARADSQCRIATYPEAPPPGELPKEAQEPGTRPTRPLGYDLHADVLIETRAGASSRLKLVLRNSGARGAHVWARANDSRQPPRSYTVAAGKSLSDDLPVLPSPNPIVRYDWTLYGANGFVRFFQGTFARSGRQVDPPLVVRVGRAQMGLSPDPLSDVSSLDDLSLSLENTGPGSLILTLADMAYGQPEQKIVLGAGARRTVSWPVATSHHWYDVGVTVAGFAGYLRRCAGHLETGHDSRTDPAALAPVWS
ncbi:MAG TPA: phospholipase C, phosphocholine-specific [Burkholderiaceae bacterium]|nr:phospholipase C, phosphocholine-specific [Burkholderiaceae bacterium]